MASVGRVSLFGCSGYNHAWIERVMGFATKDLVRLFVDETSSVEACLTGSGMSMVKHSMTSRHEIEMIRLHARYHDPLKRRKLSPIDFEAIARWKDYSNAFDEMIETTNTDAAPWTIVRANDKLRARLNAIRVVLDQVPYAGKDKLAIGDIDRRIIIDAKGYLKRGGED